MVIGHNSELRQPDERDRRKFLRRNHFVPIPAYLSVPGAGRRECEALPYLVTIVRVLKSHDSTIFMVSDRFIIFGGPQSDALDLKIR